MIGFYSWETMSRMRRPSKHDYWNCEKANHRGNCLFDHMVNNDYDVLGPLVHLYLYIIVLKISTIYHGRRLHHVFHLTTYLPVAFSVGKSFTRKPFIRYRYEDANWKQFRSYLNANIALSPKCKNISSKIDSSIEQLTAIIVKARDMSIPHGPDIITPHKQPKYIKTKTKSKNKLSEILKCKTYDYSIPPLRCRDNRFTSNVLEQCEVLADAFYDNMKLTNSWVMSFTIGCNIIRKSPNYPINKYHDADWKGYHNYINDHLFLSSKVFHSILEIDNKTTKITDILLSARNKFIPVRTTTHKPRPLPGFIKQLINTKNRFRRQEGNAAVSEHKIIRIKINALQARIKTALTTFNEN
ncbi:unnamed protein product, partial [Leptidea sinapis]